jgi:integrase
MIVRDNYFLIKRFLRYVGASRQPSADTLERYWFYLRHLLLWADGRPFSDAPLITPAFPLYVDKLVSPRSKAGLSAGSRKKIVGLARQFFEWAKQDNPHAFRRVSPLWLQTMRPARVQKPAVEKPDHQYATLDYVISLATYPLDRANLAMWAVQAAAAMLFLSGMRAGAFVTLPIKAVDLKNMSITQSPQLGVRTKNNKSATTYLYPIPELLKVVSEWDAFVRSGLPLQAPWYAPVANSWSAMNLSDKQPGQNRAHTLIRRLRHLCEISGLPYMHPHLFRHGHAVYGLKRARDVADYQAVSRNLMHSNLSLTDAVYGGLESNERARIIAGLAGQPSLPQSQDDLSRYLHQLAPGDVPRALKILAERLE